MKRTIILTMLFFLIPGLTGCGRKKSVNMVDMETMKSDGSHNEQYIFREEIERETRQKEKYKKNKF